MRSSKANGSTETNELLERDIGENIRALKRSNGAFHSSENCSDEISSDNLGALLRRVSEQSTREVGTLIDELHGLRQKLQIDGERIQNEIVRYAQLSQGIMQLTTIISDNVKNLAPDTPSVIPADPNVGFRQC